MSTNASGQPRRRHALEALARRRGVVLEYRDLSGVRHRAPTASLVAVLAALGEPLDSPEDAPKALAEYEARVGAGAPELSPVIVAWDGNLPPELEASEPAASARLVTEDGIEMAPGVGPLPYGVHELHLGEHTATVIAAPRGHRRHESERSFGLFAPTYALYDRRRAPAGDLTALRELGELGANFGARYVATLPLLAELATADGGAPGQHPYAPVSRMWWNEGYLDLDRLPEVAGLEPGPIPPPIDERRVDVASLAAARRPALAKAAENLEGRDSKRRQAFHAFQRSRPEAESYARFRAAIEARGPDQSAWPSHWRHGTIPRGEVDPSTVRRHLYAQWAFDDQLAGDAADLARRDAGFLLDLPVGCRADGFDPWANPGAFASKVSIGAPPDAFFARGQDWRLPPLHPDADRRRGHALFRQSLAHSLRHAGAVRIDHVMALSRLWWIPEGMPATGGVYVRYPTDELLAAAALEAWRHDGHLVGEDLGTVERGLIRRLRAAGISGTRVAIFDLEASGGGAFTPPPGTVASLDTHDTATFTAWLTGSDIEERQRLGILEAPAAEHERSVRARITNCLRTRLESLGLLRDAAADTAEVIGALLTEAGEADCDLVIVSLSDLLGDLEPENVPGTHRKENFAGRISKSLEEIVDDPVATGLIETLATARAKAAARIDRGGES